MTWIVWRQQRPVLITLLAGLVLGVGAALVLRALMVADISALGMTQCLQDGMQSTGACGSKETSTFLNTWFDRMRVGQVLVLGLPVLMGVFIGAPLFAREFEQGTHALAFTQSVSRTRWMATKFLVTALPVLVVVVALQLAVGNWVSAAQALGPLHMGPFLFTNFDAAGVSPAAYTLFAYTLGMFVGALAKRTLVAMTLVLGVFVVVRFAVHEIRAFLGTPKRVLSDDPFNRIPPDEGWTVTSGWVNTKGEVLPGNIDLSGCGSKGDSPVVTDPLACYREKGFAQSFRDVIPADAVGSLHLAEASIFVALAAVFVAGTVWAVRRQV